MADSASTALVAAAPPPRTTLRFAKHELILAFGKTAYYLPEEAVISAPKRCNLVTDVKTLSTICTTKSPASWEAFCDPESLLHVKGKEGSSVYTMFEVKDAPDAAEPCYIRHIPPSVCDKVFPKWQEKIADDPSRKPANDRQQARLDVLKWRTKDCARAQVNPEHNGWEVCKEPPKSLKASGAIASGGKRVGGGGRARPVGANGSVDEDVMVTTAQVGNETVKTFKIAVGKDFLAPKLIDGFLYMTTVKATPVADIVNDATAGGAGEEGEAIEDGA